MPFHPPHQTPATSGSATTSELEKKVIKALRSVYDPEIPVSIYDLGLVYETNVGDDGKVKIVMTLTSPACPEAQSLPAKVEQSCSIVRGVESVEVEIVWDPPWGPHMMSEEARLILGF